MGPTYKKNIKSQIGKGHCREFVKWRRNKFFFKFFFLLFVFLRFTENWPSEFVGINTESDLRDEGYA